MAAVQVQIPGSGAPKRSFIVPAAPPNSKTDPYHGQEILAKIAARFITHLFACPDYPPSSTHAHAKLPFFIAYALHRTKLSCSRLLFFFKDSKHVFHPLVAYQDIDYLYQPS